MMETKTLKRFSTNSDVKMEVNSISDYLKPNMPLPQYLPYARFLLDTDLSHTAKLLYTLLLDRATLSQKNNWMDERGFVYVQTPIITGSDCEGAGEMFRVTTLDLDNLPRTDDGKVDFSNMFIVLRDGATPAPYPSLTAAQTAGAVTMNIGLFINVVISFLIVAFAVFLLIKGINELQERMDAKEEIKEEAKTKECPYCCSVIPVKAVKCPNCTADLQEKKKAPK